MRRWRIRTVDGKELVVENPLLSHMRVVYPNKEKKRIDFIESPRKPFETLPASPSGLRPDNSICVDAKERHGHRSYTKLKIEIVHEI
jgi:hypothetical protein